MAEKLKKLYRAVWKFLLAGLGEYPDKIGGYHGCLPWHRSSSLKIQGNCTQLFAIAAAIDEAMAEEATVPYIDN